MKTFFLLTVLSFSLHAQIFVRGSMGLNFVNMSSVRDYLNENYAPANDQAGSFNSAVEFGGEAGYHFDGYDIALEGVYEFSSFTYSLGYAQYTFDYTIFKPSLIYYKRIDGQGYFFRLGGGIGPRLVTIEETKPPVTTPVKYTSTGFGIVIVASGNTMLAKNTYIYIAGDLRYDINGEPENESGVKIQSRFRAENISLNSLSAGIKLGITYNF